MTNSKCPLSIQATKELWFITFLFFASSVFALTESEVISAFQKVEAPHKAIAVSGIGANIISATAYSKSSPAAASLSALTSCETKRLALNSEEYCEIRVTNSKEVTPAHKIRAEVPDQHPLFLWKIVSGQATVYLAGSIHVLKQSLYPLPQQYQSAFDISENIGVEVDTSNLTPQDLSTLVNTYFLLPESQSIQQILTRRETALLIEYLGQRNTPVEAVARLKPSMLAIQLSLNQLVAMGYNQEYGLEKFFLKQIGSKNILHLETVEQQFQLLGSAPMALQRELLKDTIVRIDEMDAIIAALVTAWLGGDAESFESLTHSMGSVSPEYLAFSKKLLDDRNTGMANKIEGYLNNRGTYFIMLGAAHLIGKQSVLSLLKQQGWTITQVYSGDQI